MSNNVFVEAAQTLAKVKDLVINSQETIDKITLINQETINKIDLYKQETKTHIDLALQTLSQTVEKLERCTESTHNIHSDILTVRQEVINATASVYDSVKRMDEIHGQLILKNNEIKKRLSFMIIALLFVGLSATAVAVLRLF